jgi:hypothetical protein
MAEIGVGMSSPVIERSEIFIPSRCQEWTHLRAPDMAVSASVGATATRGVRYPEELRSGSALYAQQNIHFGSEANWQRLTTGQVENGLGPETYAALHWLSQQAMPDEETYVAGQYLNIIHDLLKNRSLRPLLGLSETDSHDEGLRRLFLPEHAAARRMVLPTFTNLHLFSERQRYLIEGVATSGLNMPRFMYSQCSPDEITQIGGLDPAILALSIAHGMHDIAGARGHESLTSSLTLDNPTANRILDASSALLGAPEEMGLPEGTEITPEVRARAYLLMRAQRLGLPVQDWETMDQADVLARIHVANFFRCDTAEDFASYNEAYESLPEALRLHWGITQVWPTINTPPKAASSDELRPYGFEYTPAMMRAVADRDKPQAIARVLGYFVQILAHAAYVDVEDGRLAGVNNLDTSGSSTTLNFYHMARWFQRNPPGPDEIIGVRYERSGTTLTPIPSDSPRTPLKLYDPDKFRTGLEL